MELDGEGPAWRRCLVLFLAGLLFLVFDPGRELGAQNKRWTAADHEQTNFPLLGKHRSVPCADCHLEWRARRHPDRLRGLPLGPETGRPLPDRSWGCIAPTAIRPSTGRSSNRIPGIMAGRTGFPLAGVHRTMDCADCHPGNMIPGPGRPGLLFMPPRAVRAGPQPGAAPITPSIAGSAISADHLDRAPRPHIRRFPCWAATRPRPALDCHKNNVYAGTPQDLRELPSGRLRQHPEPQPPPGRLFHRLRLLPRQPRPRPGTMPPSTMTSTGLCWGRTRRWIASQCHAAGYNLPRDCYGCHQTDYDTTTNPNHRQAGYSTACQNCHLTSHTSWNQAVFNHKFPIQSGNHAGFACTECHRTARTTLFFPASIATAHTKSEMDDKHDDVGGYAYNSQACYACHPSGRPTAAAAGSAAERLSVSALKSLFRRCSMPMLFQTAQRAIRRRP